MLDNTDIKYPMRLQKYLAYCGVASRRKSEELIVSGRVTVNGDVVTELGSKVNEKDIVFVDGKKCSCQQKLYFVLNKPTGYLCTVSDDFGRKTIYDLIEDKSKLFSVGRLDYQSEGLLIVTNDGDFANFMMHPSHEVTKEYFVVSDNDVTNDLIKSFVNGVKVEGETYRAINIKKGSNDKQLFITLGEGKKREIRVVYKHFKVKINKLQRVKIGNMKLSDLHIKPGEYKQISLDFLKKMIFEKKC